jgi:hypothetical protein
MTLVIDLPPDVERQLRELADRGGQAPDEYARRVVEEKVAQAMVADAEEQRESNRRAIELLRRWNEEDARDPDPDPVPEIPPLSLREAG